jgi:hypothetical protein
MENIKQAETIQVKRSQINFATYNPRRITPEARRKLEKNLETFGLMGGIIWNAMTGNLVSGHQRVGILDKNNKYKKGENDYDLFVTKVSLSEQEEKEQNIFLNNSLAQGYFDEDKLKDMMKEIDFSEATGFLKKEQVSYFAETDLTDEEYRKIAERVEETSQKIEEMHSKQAVETDSNYIVLIFKNRGDKETLINNLGLQLDDGRFCNGQVFLEQLYESYEESHG